MGDGAGDGTVMGLVDIRRCDVRATSLNMCKRMKINNLHVVARPFYRIDNLDGVFSLPFPREWIAGPGKASQRGRTAPRFPDRWILPTMCRSPPPMYQPPPAFVHSRPALWPALWICPLGPSDLRPRPRPSRTSVRSASHSLTTYSLTLGSLPSTSSSTLLSFFSLAHLLRATKPRTRRSCYPEREKGKAWLLLPCCSAPTLVRYPIVGKPISLVSTVQHHDFASTPRHPATVLNRPWYQAQYYVERELTFPVKEEELG